MIFVRLRIFVILLSALCFAVVSKKKIAKTDTVAIIQMAKLGDIICTTPLFRAVKEKNPHTKVVVIGNTINKEVVSGNKNIDQYISISRDDSFIKIVKILKSHHIDAVCITSPNFELLAACIISRIPVIVVPRITNGRSPYETRPYKILRKFVDTQIHAMGSYAPQEYLRLLEPIGIHSTDTHKDIFYTSVSLEKVRTLFNNAEGARDISMRIGILPGAGNAIKEWAPEKFAQLMNMIAQRGGVVFVLLGTEKDIEKGKIITDFIGSSVEVINFLDRLTIDELKACISTLDMVIGADTGPIYIAEALGIPTIDIVGPVDEREQPPMGKIHRIVKVEREGPELYVMNAREYDKKEARRQTDDILPTVVYKEFLDLVEFMSNKIAN